MRPTRGIISRLDDALLSAALVNLRTDPRPYLVNGLWTLRTLCLETSSSVIRVFRYSQPPRPLVDQFWFRGSEVRELLPSDTRERVCPARRLLTALAWVGVALAVWRRDALALVPATLFACLVTAHVLTYMDILYHYVRLPFVCFMAFCGLESAAALAPASLRSRALATARAAAILICGASLILTAQLLS